MSKKKLLLYLEDDLNEQKIIGIVSSQSHLEFVHALNKIGSFNFDRINDFEIKDDSGIRYFIQFKFENTETNETMLLLRTKGNVGLISKELSGIDYIIILRSEDESRSESIIEVLKTQKYIMATIELKGKSITEKLKRLLLS